MRFARFRALLVVSVLCIGAGISVWVAVESDTQADGQRSQCDDDAILIETDPEKVPATTEIEVVVLNATDRAGLAETVKDQLEDRGFSVLETDDSDAEVPDSAQVTFGAEQYLAGVHTKAYFYRGEMDFQADWDKPITIVVGDAFDQVKRTDEALRTFGQASSIQEPEGTCSID
ncbi:LytR C-terminal domain-containing protein [Haloglycomyces albus]|uniref:LytR C-terminal domain-containing protein n=1 Tax=Haloglycomyces albus TaxID=526067 RepID=UPI00046CCA2C|nr:LytR C-terminal domain-containing protein [Haloglycomyces albus]